jgi:hypothetical protein
MAYYGLLSTMSGLQWADKWSYRGLAEGAALENGNWVCHLSPHQNPGLPLPCWLSLRDPHPAHPILSVLAQWTQCSKTALASGSHTFFPLG